MSDHKSKLGTIIQQHEAQLLSEWTADDLRKALAAAGLPMERAHG